MKVIEQSTCIASLNCAGDCQSSVSQIPLTEDRLAILGHEIRNPLSALNSALQAWPPSGDDPKLTHDLLQIMRRQVAQLTRLCKDLLDTGSSAQGKLTITHDSVDIGKAIQNACEEIQPFVDQCGHTLTVALGNVSPSLIGDESRLTQVFANLLHNAAKFTDREGQIHVSLENSLNSIVVRIRDNGRGICSERLQRIFYSENEPEYRFENSGAGLGIGLRLAKSIVELHGGTIEAFSEGLGQGCTFSLILPTAEQVSPNRTQSTSIDCNVIQPIESSLPQHCIVVVDDDRSMSFLMKRLLQSLNQLVATAENGEAAVEAIIRLKPNVVFLDLHMCGMNGFDVARQIRLRPELNGVSLIALSGSSDTTSRERAAESGFDDYLVKPISINELADMLLRVGETAVC